MQSAAKLAEKWKRNLQGAAQTMRDGVRDMKVNPMEEAIKAKDLMRERLLAAIDSGKWEAGLRAVSVKDWKDMMTEFGISRAVEAAAKKQDKVEEFLKEWLPVAEAISIRAKDMPSGTEQDALEKVRMMMQMSKAFANERRGG